MFWFCLAVWWGGCSVCLLWCPALDLAQHKSSSASPCHPLRWVESRSSASPSVLSASSGIFPPGAACLKTAHLSHPPKFASSASCASLPLILFFCTPRIFIHTGPTKAGRNVTVQKQGEEMIQLSCFWRRFPSGCHGSGMAGGEVIWGDSVGDSGAASQRGFWD